MGKSSTASCFKFVGCGDPDSVDTDDLPPPETKDSSDKRKWSFRKRSARYRVLSNSAISQTSLDNKATLDAAIVSCKKQASSANTESELSEAVFPNEEKSAADAIPDESTVTIIQTSIKGFLAQKTLMNHKNIIKLQAAIRGHIVRKRAVGSLRCVHAIVKMQVLVRERHARLLLEGSRSDGNDGMLHKRNEKGMKDLGSKPLVTYTSIEELLRNKFARQLLESNSRSKTINIKCEPLKSDSAWKWMERWVSISSTGSKNSAGLKYTAENLDEKFSESEYNLDEGISHKDACQSNELSNEDSVVLPKGDENAISYGMHSFESNNDVRRPDPVTTYIDNYCDDISDSLLDQTVDSSFASRREPDSFTYQSELECKQQIDSVDRSYSVESRTKRDDISDSLPDQTVDSSFASKREHDSFINQSELECDQHIDSVNRSCSGEPETTGNKVLFGSRKASNPAFIAAQSKFEELSLAGNSAKPVGLSKQDARSEFSSDAVSLVSNVRTSETLPAEAFPLLVSEVEGGGPESGTELSITSTLDSPEGPVIGASNVLEDKDDYHDEHIYSFVDTGVESPILEGDLSCCKTVHEEKRENIALDESKDESSAMAVDSSLADKKTRD